MKRNFLNQLTASNIRKITLAAAITMLSLSAMAVPGETLLQAFSRTFPDAQYVRWTEEGEHHIVSFTQNDIQCRVWYDQKGAVIYSLRYFNENELPLSVLLAVKKKYHDKHIDGVTEVTTPQGIAYSLMLSDDKKWYAVNVNDNGNAVLKYSFRKQE